jgi:hypothetical protein
MAKHSLDFDEEEEEGFSMLGREEEQASAAGNDVMSVAEFAARISLPTAIAVASKRNTGKTVMISALVRELLTTKKVTQVLVMSQTVHVNRDYWFLPERMRQPFNEGVIKRLLDRQATTKKADREQVLLVLDDVLSDKEAEKSRFVKRLFTLGRHYDINVVLISQTSNVALTPAIKQNADYLAYSRQNRYMLESIYSTVTNIDKKTFIAWSEANNKNYTFLIVDNTSQSNDPEDFLLKVRVSPEEAKRISEPKTEKEDARSQSSEEEQFA